LLLLTVRSREEFGTGETRLISLNHHLDHEVQMKRLAIAIALFSFLTVWYTKPAHGQPDEISSEAVRTLDLNDCKILLIFARLWKYSPLDDKERAAWIVLNSKGEYESIDWPHTPQRRITVWSEPLPDHIAAQAHTHGDHLDPKPSPPDAAIARRLRIPVYTLSRKGIWRVTPDGVITQELAHGWFKNTMEKCGEDLISK